MSYIYYGVPILDVSRSHTTTHHIRQDSSGRVISSSQRPLPDNTLLITRPEESYRLWCVVVCDLETSRIGAPYIYDVSSLSVKVLTTQIRRQNYLQRLDAPTLTLLMHVDTNQLHCLVVCFFYISLNCVLTNTFKHISSSSNAVLPSASIDYTSLKRNTLGIICRKLKILNKHG